MIVVSRFLTALAASLLCVLLGASVVVGKEGVRATLETPAAIDAAPGQTTTIAWTLRSIEGGERHPFTASGVFVRLLSASGGEPTKAVGTEGPLGRYVAEVTVPEGGISRIKFGLEGTRMYPGGRTEDADVYFPIDNDPLARPPGPPRPGASQMPPIWPAAGGALLALGGLLGTRRVLTSRRRRRDLPHTDTP